MKPIDGDPVQHHQMQTQKRIGLARALSKMGHCSRSQASVRIRAGRVSVNGRVERDAEHAVRLPADRIEVDGLALRQAAAIYLVMNKPRGLVTTASDEQRRETVYDLLDPELPWVGPVGRLDKASEGLLLLTNDSEWAAKITAPSSHLDKRYHVQIDCVADADLLARITLAQVSSQKTGANLGHKPPAHKALGHKLEDLSAKDARLLRHGGKNSWIEITLDGGKNRQIRRLLESVGVRVLRLVRVAIGPLELGELKKGAVRPLTPHEKQAIDRAVILR